MRLRLLLALPLLLVLAAVRAAPERVALVIGNAGYPDAPLTNTPNDAADMAAKLRGLGFRVDLRQDLGRRDSAPPTATGTRPITTSTGWASVSPGPFPLNPLLLYLLSEGAPSRIAGGPGARLPWSCPRQ
jgi:hypothetical protein